MIVVGGGDERHLMQHVRDSGLQEELPDLLRSRVYVGISSGSIILSGTVPEIVESLYYGRKGSAVPGLGYVEFTFLPHLNSRHFPKVRDRLLRSAPLPQETYALDDSSAIAIIDGKMEIVSEGAWKGYPAR